MATIYDVIKTDHDNHRKVLSRLDKTEGESAERRDLYETMKAEVEAHTAAEEETFYAALLGKPDTQERARHSVSEHEEAANLLKELDGMELSNPGWLAKFRKLKDELEHHMDEEEEDIFAKARDVISTSEAEKLGHKFRERKQAEA